MTANLARAPLTQILLTNLATGTGRPVGDGEAPNTAGWQGEPNLSTSTFIPYTVLMPQAATMSSGPFDDDQGDWRLPYSIWGFGVKRVQCEAISDLARNILSEMRGQVLDLGDQKYSVQQVRTETIGGVARYDQTNPPYWGQQDTITVWLTHERQ